MSETRQAMCSAYGCNLGSTMADMCIFHANIERRYWGDVTRFITSPEGSKLVKASRDNRMMWAVNVFDEEVVYHNRDKATGAEIVFHPQAKAIEILGIFKKKGILPEFVDLENKQQTIDQLTQSKGQKHWLKDHQCFFSLDWVCATYEAILIQHVRDRIGAN